MHDRIRTLVDGESDRAGLSRQPVCPGLQFILVIRVRHGFQNGFRSPRYVLGSYMWKLDGVSVVLVVVVFDRSHVAKVVLDGVIVECVARPRSGN